MSTSRGTGIPLHFKCSVCRKSCARWETRKECNAVRTGRTKAQASANKGNWHRLRQLRERHEYRCLRCGHVGWTNHHGILDYPVEVSS